MKEKKKKSTIWYIIDTILMTVLLISVIFLFIDGRYISVKVVETCQGKPINTNITLVLNEEGKPIDAIENNNSLLGKEYEDKITGEKVGRNPE